VERGKKTGEKKNVERKSTRHRAPWGKASYVERIQGITGDPCSLHEKHQPGGKRGSKRVGATLGVTEGSGEKRWEEKKKMRKIIKKKNGRGAEELAHDKETVGERGVE